MATLAAFTSTLKGDVVTPEDPTYPAAITRWAKNAERNAKLIVFAKDADDVAAAIAYAKDNQLPFAIRGGGHNAAGASSIEGGLVVDLSRHLNHVRIDAEAKLGYVGGGALWRDVDAEAIKYGLATVGGTVNHTGVGGLTLGGGYGWLCGRHGMTIDNLRQATVVTASGSILKASETDNPDLFWAIRGGGSNFGVVTEFVFQLHEQRKTVYAGPVVYSPDKVEQILELTKTWWANIGADEATIQAAASQGGRPVFVVVFFYNGSEAEGRANFKAFLDIEHIVDGTEEIPYEQLNSLQNSSVNQGRSYYLTGTAQKAPNAAATVEVLQKCVEIEATEKFVPVLLHEYFPLNKINSVDSSATPFRRQLSPNILVILSWEGEVERTQKAREAAKGLVEIVTRHQREFNDEKIGYTNYDMDASVSQGTSVPNWDDKARQGFGSNYPRLQSIKKQYDPEVFFNRWFPISPAA